MTDSRLLFIDSCSIVNLYASAHFDALLASLDGSAMIVDLVQNESQFIRTRGEDGGEEKEPIRLDNSIMNGHLTPVQLHFEKEFELFIELATRLDDGEAATLALAATRDGVLVTDDRKALSIAGELAVPTITTPDVILRWVELTGISPPVLRQVLQNIRWRARYEPNRQHPRSAWWRASIESG